MVNGKRLSTLETEISKEQDTIISSGVQSSSVLLRKPSKPSAMSWLSFGARTKIYGVPLPLCRVVSLSFPLPPGSGKRTLGTLFLRAPKFALAQSPLWGRFSALKK